MSLLASSLALGYGRRLVAADLSLTVEKGAMIALIGPNGCGKSTLLHALGRLLAPQAGALTLDGAAFQQWRGRDFARNVAILPQNPTTPEGLSVRELVAYGRHPHRGLFGATSRADEAAIAEALFFTGLSAMQHRPVTDLSGGERQRVWIAMALAQQAATLLLDEPTTYLDIGHQLELMELLARLNAERGLTIIVSLHDLGQAARYARRLVVMRRGRIYADGPVQSVFCPTMLAEVFGIEAEIAWRDDRLSFEPLRLICPGACDTCAHNAAEQDIAAE